MPPASPPPPPPPRPSPPSPPSDRLRGLNDGLRQCQQGLIAAELYGLDHATARDPLAAAATRLRDVAADGPIEVLHVEGRVTAMGQRLPGSEPLGRYLFDRIRQRGADALTIGPAITPDDLTTLVRWLGPGDAPPPAGPGLRVGHVRGLTVGLTGGDTGPSSPIANDTDPRQEAPAIDPADARGPADGASHADLLRDAITPAGPDAPPIDTAAIGHVVSRICLAVSSNADAILPLTELKSHDEYTFVHTANVATLSIALAEAAGLSTRATREVGIAALLHDVGKTRVPLELLGKRARLTDAEFALIRRHPVDGMRMLLETPGVPPLAAIVAFEHHMGSDGSGYPYVVGSRGRRHQPHLASRIVHIADVFDALATDRPYRAGMPLSKVGRLMLETRDSYDARLLDLFLDRVARRTARGADSHPADGRAAA